MSNPINDGGPAFPGENRMVSSDPKEFEPLPGHWSGMSLRAYFAGQAMVAWISGQPTIKGVPLNGDMANAKSIAGVACNYADALIAELGKEHA